MKAKIMRGLKTAGIRFAIHLFFCAAVFSITLGVISLARVLTTFTLDFTVLTHAGKVAAWYFVTLLAPTMFLDHRRPAADPDDF